MVKPKNITYSLDKFATTAETEKYLEVCFYSMFYRGVFGKDDDFYVVASYNVGTKELSVILRDSESRQIKHMENRIKHVSIEDTVKYLMECIRISKKACI